MVQIEKHAYYMYHNNDKYLPPKILLMELKL
jgi:hypothetical protein